MKNMGFISALADKDVALAILREHYNEVQIEDFSKGKTDQSELASISNQTIAQMTERVLVLFEMTFSTVSDYIEMDNQDHNLSSYKETEKEILIQDGIKF